MYDIAIIGGGIIGCMMARQLCRYDLKIILLDKNNDIANETTKANSGIIHSGYDPNPGTLKARLNRDGNPMFDVICRELGVLFQRNGSLTIALSDDEIVVLHRLYEQGCVNRIPGLSLLDADAVRRLEPNCHPQVRAGLLAKTAGIVDPFGLAIALAENAADHGANIILNSEVLAIDRDAMGYRLTTSQQTISTRFVINCGGVYAGQVQALLAPTRFTITPRRGEYVVFDKQAGNLVKRTIFQCPSDTSKGVLVAPTVHGNLLVGPNAEVVKDQADVSTTAAGLHEIVKAGSRSVHNIPMDLAINHFAGLRASPDTGDFIIEELDGYPGFINVAGIESPGLTAAPAIADYVIELLDSAGLELQPNQRFNPERQPVSNFMELSDREKEALIRSNPLYGRIICRCESITEAEIVESIHRSVGARTVDGVKRRVRAGMGRCQGGFCGPRIIEILARELHQDAGQILKDEQGSYLLTGQL